MNEKLIQKPIKIGEFTVPARIVMPPMATGKAVDGHMTPELCDYYVQRAENPYVGMIITEHCYITMQGKAHDNQVSVSGDEDIPSLSLLPERIHNLNNGTVLLMQISHAGAAASSKCTGLVPVGPSEVTNREEAVCALSIDEIHDIKMLFVAAALRAQQAGYDGIELHAAHGYLLSQFFSPLTNHREDQYGYQSVINRVRFLKETVQEIRKAVSNDFIVAVRIGASDADEGGTKITDSVEACRILEEAGADLIHISGGIGGYNRPKHQGPGYFKEESQQIMRAVEIPVIMTGGVNTIGEAEELLEADTADLIGIGRALIKNANLSE